MIQGTLLPKYLPTFVLYKKITMLDFKNFALPSVDHLIVSLFHKKIRIVDCLQTKNIFNCEFVKQLYIVNSSCTAFQATIHD